MKGRREEVYLNCWATPQRSWFSRSWSSRTHNLTPQWVRRWYTGPKTIQESLQWPCPLTFLNIDSDPIPARPDCALNWPVFFPLALPAHGRHSINLSLCWWILNMMMIDLLNYHQMQEPWMSPHLIISGSEVPLPTFLLPSSWSRDGSFPNANHHSNSADYVEKTKTTLLEKAGARFNVVAYWCLKDNVLLISPKVEHTKKSITFSRKDDLD